MMLENYPYDFKPALAGRTRRLKAAGPRPAGASYFDLKK